MSDTPDDTAEDFARPADDSVSQFQHDLEKLINHHSMENGSDTPDFMLASYLMDCLHAYEHLTAAREAWHGRRVPIRKSAVPLEIKP